MRGKIAYALADALKAKARELRRGWDERLLPKTGAEMAPAGFTAFAVSRRRAWLHASANFAGPRRAWNFCCWSRRDRRTDDVQALDRL